MNLPLEYVQKTPDNRQQTIEQVKIKSLGFPLQFQCNQARINASITIPLMH